MSVFLKELLQEAVVRLAQYNNELKQLKSAEGRIKELEGLVVQAQDEIKALKERCGISDDAG